MAKYKYTLAVLTGHERGQWVHPTLSSQLIELARACPEMEFCNAFGQWPVTAARNGLAHVFLERGAEYLVMVDNDQALPPDFLKLLRMMDRERKRIVCVPTPMLNKEQGGLCYNVSKAVTHNGQRLVIMPTELPADWLEIEFGGSGCIIVHREVFQKLAEPWFEFSAERFTMGEACNEDFEFCQKARAAGFQVWTHGGFIAEHFKTASLGFMLETIRKHVNTNLSQIQQVCAARGVHFSTPQQMQRRLLGMGQ